MYTVGYWFLYFIIRYDRKVRATRDRLEELGLMGRNITSTFCLDEWEVNREHVVLNRTLGQGAFGTVYGGEVRLDDVWVAVAVKTLKAGSTAEDKVLFDYRSCSVVSHKQLLC